MGPEAAFTYCNDFLRSPSVWLRVLTFLASLVVGVDVFWRLRERRRIYNHHLNQPVMRSSTVSTLYLSRNFCAAVLVCACTLIRLFQGTSEMR